MRYVTVWNLQQEDTVIDRDHWKSPSEYQDLPEL